MRFTTQGSGNRIIVTMRIWYYSNFLLASNLSTFTGTRQDYFNTISTYRSRPVGNKAYHFTDIRWNFTKKLLKIPIIFGFAAFRSNCQKLKEIKLEDWYFSNFIINKLFSHSRCRTIRFFRFLKIFRNLLNFNNFLLILNYRHNTRTPSCWIS